MVFDPKNHQAIHSFELPAAYHVEVLHKVTFVNGKMEKLVWPKAPNHQYIVCSDKKWDYYHNEHRRLLGLKEAWLIVLYDLRDQFIEYHKTNKTGIKFTGIKTIDTLSQDSPNGYTVQADGKNTTHVVKFTFDTEGARLAFAEFVDKHGYGEALYSFFESPKTGKTYWKPVT